MELGERVEWIVSGSQPGVAGGPDIVRQTVPLKGATERHLGWRAGEGPSPTATV